MRLYYFPRVVLGVLVCFSGFIFIFLLQLDYDGSIFLERDYRGLTDVLL